MSAFTPGKIAFLIGSVVLLGLLLFLVAGEYGLLHLMDLQKEKATIDERIQKLELENQRLRIEVKRLRTDPDYLEQVIRDEMGLVNKDDLVFVFENQPPDNQ